MTAPAHRYPAAASSVGIGWRHPHYAALLEQQPALDFIEVHSENFFAPGGAAGALLKQARAHYPVSLHGVGLSLGSAEGLDPWHLDQLARLVAEIEPVRVSDHAAFARGTVDGRLRHAADLLPLPLSQAALQVLCDNVQRVQDRLRRAIAVENISACVQWADADMDEPAFLLELSRRSGCTLLVDVNNAYVNAMNAQRRGEVPDALATARRWIDAIAAAPVAELHLAGHDDTGTLVIDDHGSPVCDAVWSLYRHAIDRLGPVPTLIEWDTALPAFDVLLEEVARARHHAAQIPTRQLEPA